MDVAPRAPGSANARAPDELIYIGKCEVKARRAPQGEYGKNPSEGSISGWSTPTSPQRVTSTLC